MKLRVVRGKEDVVIWRRSSWTSMPHIIEGTGPGVWVTRCGYDVRLGEGVNGVVLTAIPAEMFAALGCSRCRNYSMRDLAHEIHTRSPGLMKQYKDILSRLEWNRGTGTP